MSKRPSHIGVTGSRKRTLAIRFGRAKDGAAAIEFAIVAPIFVTMMFSLFEVGWYFYVNSIVDASVADTARIIETGQLQKSVGTDAQKKQAIYDEVCGLLSHFGSCSERLTVEVQTFPDFATLAASTTAATCATATQDQKDAIPFEPGTELSIVRVRICFLYTTANPVIGLNVVDPETGKRELISSAIFRNEPYLVNSGTP